MATREERIMALAATLRSSGIAKSDAQAKMMAEEMVGVEDNVQKKFDEEHRKAQEYLKTAKNLGEARQHVRTVDEEAHDKKIHLEEVYTDLNLGNKPIAELMMAKDEMKGEPVVKEIPKEIPKEEMPRKEFKIELPEKAPEEELKEEPREEIAVEQEQSQQVKLDSEKLVEMMEEDGKLEEHTREIKEKPKNVKPKEEYEEDKIDLSSMFNVNK